MTVPWSGSSVGLSVVPMCQGCGSLPSQGAYKNQPMNASVVAHKLTFLFLPLSPSNKNKNEKQQTTTKRHECIYNSAVFFGVCSHIYLLF